MRWIPTLGLAAIVASAFAFASYGAPDAAAIIKARQDNMKTNAGSLKAISDELKKSDPSVDVIKGAVQKLSDNLPNFTPAAFPAGTGTESGVKTSALPAIWQKPADFKTAYDDYAAAEKKFAGVVAGGNLAAIKSGFPAFGKTCGNCHRNFRAKEN